MTSQKNDSSFFFNKFLKNCDRVRYKDFMVGEKDGK